jgi:hypothetical protein
MTKQELSDIRDRANKGQDRYLSPIAVNGLCTDIFVLLAEVERLRDMLAWFDREGDLKVFRG